MLKKYLEQVRTCVPLIHNITNYVTVNDCANILIACGGAPIMADDAEEAEAITTACQGLNINIGTLNQRTIPAMLLAGKKASELGHPVLLDPVGVGASPLRTRTAQKLLDEVKFTVIRGNLSEIRLLAQGTGSGRGVDASEADRMSDEEIIAFARELSGKTGAVIVITGARDFIVSTGQTAVVSNGVPEMSQITGSGCMLSAMTTAYITANPEAPFEASLASVCLMGLAGELAEAKRAERGDGNASFRNYLIDAVSQITSTQLEEGAKYVLG